MIASLVIAFREGLEAALIVGIVLSYLSKTGQARHARYAWAGVGAAVLVSVALALVIQAIGAELEGPAEPIFEGTMMLLAVGILTWMIFWMRYQSRTLKKSLEHEIQATIGAGHARGLFAVAFFAVAREGLETALFLSAAAFATNGTATIIGTILGLGAAVLVGYLIFASTIRLNLRTFFNVTGVLLLLFAAGLFANAIHEFQEVGLLFTLQEHVWNLSPILSDESALGQVLKAMIGYNASPSLEQAVGYVAYWVFVLVGLRWVVDRRIARLEAVAA
ncbi:MAG: iron uptake transporter permease EfeU [Chloroflexota bacterium]